MIKITTAQFFMNFSDFAISLKTVAVLLTRYNAQQPLFYKKIPFFELLLSLKERITEMSHNK